MTLNTISGYEYSRDKSATNTSGVFNGLNAGSEYSFYQRIAQTVDTLASAWSAALSVTTDEDSYDGGYYPPYTPEPSPTPAPEPSDKTEITISDDVIYVSTIGNVITLPLSIVDEYKGHRVEVTTPLGGVIFPASALNPFTNLFQTADNKDVDVKITLTPFTDEQQTVYADYLGYDVVRRIVKFDISAQYGEEIKRSSALNDHARFWLNLGANNSAFTAVVTVDADNNRRAAPFLFRTFEDGTRRVMIAGLDTSVSLALIYSPQSYNDIGSHWGKSVIDLLGNQLIIEPKEDGGFHPQELVTEAEFARILSEGLAIPVSSTYLADIDAPLTREYAISATVKLLRAYGLDAGLHRRDRRLDQFTDAYKIGEANYDELEDAYDYGIISGCGNGTLAPDKNMTVTEAIALLNNLLNLLWGEVK
ncbi:hypothetical protein FACS1894208_11380 [Clostridia bacterium]|nr:hypothetical protein FACS1894208_11380 [Clostridia bacterium]